MQFESLSDAVLSIAVIMPRIAAAFLALPYFSSDTIPPLVRNTFFVSLSLAVMPLVLEDPRPIALGVDLIPLLVKELFIGVAIGFTFGIIFWALEGAGQVIDAKIGTNTAQLVDPLTGHQTTLIGAYLGRLAGYVFAAFGGLQLFFELLMSSFQVWPVLDPMPSLPAIGALFFIGRFDELMRLVLLLAAPVLCVLTLVEVGLGFVNRYAPQLNVFTLSMSLKAWLAIPILLLTVANTVEFVIDWMGQQRGLLTTLPW
jgi:type III secretion protein T